MLTSTTIAPAALKKIKTFFMEKAPTCVHAPDGMLKHRFVTPSYAVKAGADDNAGLPERSATGHYLQMYDWDSCFFSQAAPQVNIHGLSADVVANFLSLKDAEGHVPRTVSPARIWDAGDECKPFLCQTLLHQVRVQKTAAEAKPNLDSFIEDLDSYLQYFERHRKSEHGLYRWRNVLESGVDDNLALISPREAAKDEDDSVSAFPDGQLLAVDLSSYLVAEFKAFAELCKMQNKLELAEKYTALASRTSKAIEEFCWNESIGMYCNVNPKDNSQVVMRAWTGLVPALLGLAKSERIEQVIKSNICNEKHFLRPAGIASVAASEPLYNNALRGLYGRAIVSNWQGPVWVLTTAFVVRCLMQNGFKKEAADVSTRMLNTLHNDIEENGTLHENYHAETGKALWAPDFMSWNILALELVDILA
jgi:neutral trehalase